MSISQDTQSRVCETDGRTIRNASPSFSLAIKSVLIHILYMHIFYIDSTDFLKEKK